ncbi:MAG TPA: PDZ domain-containing protein, partial [Polyangiaceae bacterium]|nr:PDZ domain-containing protein [Polyangiaceae bacterium]
RIAVRLGARQLSALAQGAEHVTFRGRVSVEFDPARSGGPVLRGQSDETVLDVFQRARTDAADGGFESFLGVTLTDALVVDAVEADSEAGRAGLALGDHLLELDGLRLTARADFLPAAGLDVSALVFERPDHDGVATALVDRARFQPASSAAAAEALMLAAALLVALLLAARPPRVLVWALGRVGRKSAAAAAVPLAGQGPAFGVVAGVLWLVIGDPGRAGRAWFGWFDLELTLLLGGLCVLLSAFALGGSRQAGSRQGARSAARASRPSGRRRFSATGALLGAFGAALWLVPVFAAAVLRASETGSLKLADLSRLQGPTAFGWALLDSPAALALALASWCALLPRGGFRPALELESPMASPRRLAEVIGTFGKTWLAGVWVVAFAGGAEGFGTGSLWGGLWFAGKLWLVLAALGAASRWLAEPRVTDSWSLLGRVVFPTVLVGLGLFALALRGGPELAHVELLRRGVLVWLLGLCVLMGVSATRALGHSGRRADPWI